MLSYWTGLTSLMYILLSRYHPPLHLSPTIATKHWLPLPIVCGSTVFPPFWLTFWISNSSWQIFIQAEILAKYKPTVNATLLIPNLRQVEETTTKALNYFKSTRHIILYYEDIVKNRTVSNINKSWAKIDVSFYAKFPNGMPRGLVLLGIRVNLLFAEIGHFLLDIKLWGSSTASVAWLPFRTIRFS